MNTHNTWRGLLALLLAVFAAGVVFAPAMAQEDEPTDDEVNAIAKQLFCPVCENIPLDVCGTQACAQWRETIRDLLREGYTEQEVKDYFVARYGERVLAAPRAQGANLIFWILPPVLALVGVVFLVQVFRTSTRKQARSAAPTLTPASQEEADYLQRLEQDLEDRP